MPVVFHKGFTPFQASEDSADGSAASLRSGSGRKKTSRMVKVDYSKKEGGPVAIKEELAGDGEYSSYASWPST